MSQAERISRIHQLLKARRFVTTKQLMDDLRASRATVMRDIELLRDRLLAPIYYSSEESGYSYHSEVEGVGRVCDVPGLWLSASQAYALLTAMNVLAKIDPGIIRQYVQPSIGVLKTLITNEGRAMKRLNEKIFIDLPAVGEVQNLNRAVPRACHALAEDIPVTLTWQCEEGQKELHALLTAIILRADGWYLLFREAGGDNFSGPSDTDLQIPLRDVIECTLDDAVDE